MIYAVSHTTTYNYRDPVALSHHVIRLAPRDVAGQRCLRHRIEVDPAPASMVGHSDYFGNAVAVLQIDRPHTRLFVRSVSTVERARVAPLDPSETPGWEQVRNLSQGIQIGAALEASEFVWDSPLVQTDDGFIDYASPSFPPSRPILEAVLDLTARIHHDFTFDQQATTVATPAAQVLKQRRGVCQDFAHLQIACLRALGLPARYVSGYIQTIPRPGMDKLVGCDASHAWVSFYCPGLGWIDVDPTNNLLVSDRHITVGWGRDFSDVSPVRGVILGSGDHTVAVSVDVQELAREETNPAPF